MNNLTTHNWQLYRQYTTSDEYRCQKCALAIITNDHMKDWFAMHPSRINGMWTETCDQLMKNNLLDYQRMMMTLED